MSESMEVIDGSREFFAPCSSDLIDSLLGQYKSMRMRIDTIANLMDGEMSSAVGYFISGNKENSYHMPSVEKLFRADGAIKSLNSFYWSKAISMTDVMNCMPQKRRDEWNESIREMTAPEFTEEAVRPTIFGLLASRQKFFAERVDGIFRSLSGEHVTNSPTGFNKRMILAYVYTSYGTTNSTQVGHINDLRTVIAKFMGRDELSWNATSSIVREAMERHGEWLTLDGGALRIRVYLKGTAHLEVHPDIAYRLNQVLAYLYPMAIAPEFRAKPTKKHKEFQMMGRPLPFAVLDLISGLRRTKNTNSFYVPINENKIIREEAMRVLVSIGGILSELNTVNFDYDPIEIFREIVTSGCIPDQKSHQFYETPACVAEAVIAIANIQPTDSCLEPSAGQGGLARYMPAERTLCVEISELHCSILKCKGFNTINGDFLLLANSLGLFNVVIINPPFSEGRAEAHVTAAIKCLKPEGRIVAVVPMSLRNKFKPAGCFVEWPEVFHNEFQGTSISVAVMLGVKI